MMLELLVAAAVSSCCLALLVGAALTLLRVRNPHLQRSAWCAVLTAALALPLLMWLARVQPVALPSITSSAVVDLAAVVAQGGQQRVFLYIYLSVAALLLLRHGWGVGQAFVLLRTSQRVDGLLPGQDARVAARLGAPVSIGGTIVLPSEYGKWSQAQLAAVLAHELSHVQRRDFLVMSLAYLHRAVFWFNPLAWWLPRRLGLLNEHLSDDAAVAALGDRGDYARMLLDLASAQPLRVTAIAMARPATVAQRVERILAAEATATQPGRAVRASLLLAVLAPTVVIAAQAQVISDRLNREPMSNPLVPLLQPEYPAESRLASEQGTVVLRVYVLENGTVADVEVQQSSGYAKLDAAAAQTALNWRVEPALSNGMPVGAWGQFAVSFRMTD